LYKNFDRQPIHLPLPVSRRTGRIEIGLSLPLLCTTSYPWNLKMTVDIAQIQKQGFFVLAAIPDQLLLQIKELDNFNQIAQKKKRFYDNIVLAYTLVDIILGVLVFFIMPLFGPRGSRLVPFFFFLLILCVFGTIIFSFIAGRWQKKELPTYRHTLARSVINILARDMDNYGMLSLSLSFVNDSRPDHTTTHPRKPGWRIDSYFDQFLKLDGKFQDGTQFSIRFTERMKEKKGRNINGKFRVKPVNKGMEICIRLRARRSLYGDLSRFAPLFGQGSKSVNVYKLLNLSRDTLKKVKVKGQSLIIVVAVPEATPLRLGQPTINLAGRSVSVQISQLELVQTTFVTALLAGYQILNLARRVKEQPA
jgi:hypothetical protein